MFQTEQELVKTITSNTLFFANLVPQWKKYKKDDLHILEETNLGYGIPDLILTKYNAHRVIECRSKKLKYDELFVYNVISKYTNGISHESLTEKTKLSSSRVKSILKNLQHEDMITCVAKGFCVNPKSKIKSMEVLAIEAKLRDWKRALKQAYRYKWFASFSYVFLDERYIKPAFQNKSLFKSYNVGLVAVKKSGEINVLVKPQRNKPYDYTMLYLLREYLLFGEQK